MLLSRGQRAHSLKARNFRGNSPKFLFPGFFGPEKKIVRGVCDGVPLSLSKPYKLPLWSSVGLLHDNMIGPMFNHIVIGTYSRIGQAAQIGKLLTHARFGPTIAPIILWLA